MADPGTLMALGSQAQGKVAGVGQVFSGLLNSLLGGRKLRQARSFYEKNKFQIPEAAKAALGVAERQASTMRLPGEDIMRSRLAETTATGVGAAQQAASSGGDVLNVLSNLMAGQNQGEQNIAMAGAERFDRNQLLLRQELGRMSDLERERWRYNVLAPAQQMFAQAEALQSRGTQEMNAGFGALGMNSAQGAQLGSAEAGYNDFLGQMGLTASQRQMSNAQEQLRRSRQNLPSYTTNYYQQPQLRVD